MSDQEDKDLSRLKEAAEALSEHFDTVQIFVTRLNDEHDEDGEGTMNATWGTGNWFARWGFLKAWIVRQEERERIAVRNE